MCKENVKKHTLGNKILKFEEDDLTGFKPVYNEKKEIIGYIEKDEDEE